MGSAIWFFVGFMSAFVIMAALLLIGAGIWFLSYQKHRKEATKKPIKRKMPIQIETESL